MEISNVDKIEDDHSSEEDIPNANDSMKNQELNKTDQKASTKKSNVPEELLKRFKVIKQRTEEETKRSREKRLRYLQKSVKEKVDREITLPEDRDILRKYDVKFGPPVDSRKRKITDKEPDKDSEKEDSSPNYDEVNQYLGINDHLKGIDRGKAAPKSGLEQTIDEAIKLGEFDTVEKLSDKLATRDFGKRVADAFAAKDFVEKKKKEECSKEKKKKKLPWGFEQKHRWETKSNM